MLDYRRALTLLLAGTLSVASWCPVIGADKPVNEQDRSPTALQARLDEAEGNYKSGKVDLAIEQANSLVNVLDNSFLQSDRVSREAKADLSVFNIKGGHPEKSAEFIRDLLIRMQLELPMDPKYQTNAAGVLADSPATLKRYFSKTIDRLQEKNETQQIIDSLIDNTVPKDYAAQLKTYCERMEVTNKQLEPLQQIASIEDLNYGDPLHSLAESDDTNKNDPNLSADKLEKIGKDLNDFAVEVRTMPVGDARAMLGLYQLALVSNSAQRYAQGETFAQQSLNALKSLTDDSAMIPGIRIAMAYSLLKQGKKDEFKILRDDVLKRLDDQERPIVTLARFTQLSGDDAGALAIYKRVVEIRKQKGNTQKPEWQDDYDALVKKVESPSEQKP